MLPPCFDCGCIPPNIPDDLFKQAVLITLCNILVATGGGAENPFEFQPEVDIDDSAITGAYVATGFFAGMTQSNFFRISNNTDATINVRVGAAGGTFTLLSNSSEVFSSGIYSVDEFYLKHAGVAPTLGNVTFEGAAR